MVHRLAVARKARQEAAEVNRRIGWLVAAVIIVALLTLEALAAALAAHLGWTESVLFGQEVWTETGSLDPVDFVAHLVIAMLIAVIPIAHLALLITLAGRLAHR